MKKQKPGVFAPTCKETEFKKRPLALACAVALFATAAAAQQAPAPAPADPAKKEDTKADAKKKKEESQKVDVVVVTGIRRGIEDAISVKQNSTSIVEAVSAEDIGKLPDNSIAESIARLPGLAAQRVAGRAQTISIRGLSGDFAGTILNGREQVSTGDNRAVEFDQYPSELLSAVVIYKTPDATLIGQGLSGTIDLQTVRPLSFGKRAVALNLRTEKNSLGKLNSDTKDTGNRFSASYIDQSDDKKFGIALGYAHLESPSQAQRWEAWGYPDAQGKPGVPNGTLMLGGSKQFADSTKGTRDGLMAVLEWKPSADYSSLLDLYYSKFDQKTVLRGYEAGLEWGGGTLSNPTVSGGLLTAGTWTGIKPVLRNDFNKRDDKITALGWNNKFNLGDGWTAVGDLSYSKADRNETILETYAGTITARDTVRFTTDGNGRPNFTYGLNYADASTIRLLDSGGWGQDGYVKYPKVTDKANALRLTGKKDLEGMFSAVEFGANFSNREKTRFVDEYFLTLKTPNTIVPSNLLVSPTSLGFVGVPGILSYDAQGALDSLYNRRSNINNRDIINKEWLVEEKVATVFTKLEIDSVWGGVAVRGNVGVQYVNTDQSSTASAVNNAGSTFIRNRVTDGKKYNDFLPSLNLAFSLPYEQTLRLGIAKTMARARLDQLRASNNFSVDVTRRIFTGDGGNPRLEPFRANSYDISWEKYFGNKAYIGAAYFKKDLKSYIYTDKIVKDYTGYPNNTTVSVLSNLGEYSAPVNGKGGEIHGFELSASLPLNLIAKELDGFGFVASHSDTDSGIKPNGPNGGTQPLPGLSRRVTNLTAYFEKYGFSARVSQRERSPFVGEVTGFGADREFRYIKGEKVLDFQVGYSFDAGSLKGLSILLQVNNATNEPYRTYDSVPTKPNQYTVYGRTTLLGVSYKF